MLLLTDCSSHPQSSPSTTSAPAAGASRTPIVSAAVSRQLGLPVYPGARPTSDGVVKPSSHGGTIVGAYYRSADPLSKVEAYYGARLPKGSLKMFINQADGGIADFLLADKGVQRQVVLVSDQGGTLVQLTAIKKK
ncbi:MAG: hypothetical protein M3Z37_10275 [Candidatus Eremiobacteraeota bacterium]|nr:hypothetical protein [Candidatus Eremiobacteraeota bacterium]